MAGMDPLKETALREFGIPYLFPWQRLVIANILDAVDAEQRLAQAKFRRTIRTGKFLTKTACTADVR